MRPLSAAPSDPSSARTAGPLPEVLRVALLGAESTGKTSLSQALAASLHTRGIPVALVPEVLREWCAHQGRTPRPHEQMGIAQEQADRSDAAAAGLARACPSGLSVVLTDTSPLMVAVYSELLFGDRSLYPFAVAHQRADALTLVMGLDMPWVADAMRDGPHAQVPTDTLLRAALHGASIPYQLIYGHGAERLAQAERALDNHASMRPWRRPPSAPPAARWHCESCGDANCEHRLFQRLRLGGAG